ncbi:MAG TPA: DinB family protein [Ktedonobacteraceae bacterium]|nr:DinB family protein [Ktedonobacteraceae bacterium]
MDILDRYLGYEAATLRHFIGRCREVSPDQLHQQFDIGHSTIHETLVHIISNLESWTDLMRGHPVRQFPPVETVDDYVRRFDDAIADFSSCARQLARENRLDDFYTDVLDNPPTKKTFGGTLLHVLTHTTVHRWEIQHMLQRVGLRNLIEGDALGWEQHIQRQAD